MYLRQIGWIIFLHLFGDYILQNDYIARMKKNSWYHMAVHCFLYSFPFLTILNGVSVGLLFLSHFIIDTLKARYQKTPQLQDQGLHFFILGLLYLFQVW